MIRDQIVAIIDKTLFAQNRKIWHIYLGAFILFFIPLFIVGVFTLHDTYVKATNFALLENTSEVFLTANLLKERLDMLVEFGAAVAHRPSLTKLTREGKWDEAIRLVQDVPADFEYVDKVLLVDKEGVIKAQWPSVPSYVGLDRSNTDWYRHMKQNWESYVSKVYPDPLLKERNIVAVAVPIKLFEAAAGETEQALFPEAPQQMPDILLLYVTVKTFSDLCKIGAAADKGEFIYVVDREGNLVIHPKFQMQTGVVSFKEVPTVQKLLAGERGSEVTYNPIEKEKRLATFDLVPKYGWGVVLAKPWRLAFAQRNQDVRHIAWVYSVMLLLSLFVVILIVFVLEERARIDRVKDDFISTISHEIRNPLFAMRESISQVAEGICGPTTQQQNEFLAIALTSIDRLGRIINDLLDVAKMEAGKMRLNFGWFNLAETIQKMTALILPRAKAKGIEIKNCFPAENMEIFGDEERIAQVFFNLVGNALKFTQRGHVEVAVGEREDVVECSVSDTGMGIPPAQVADLFSKLRKYTSTSRSRGKGTGLGLIITREIVGLHGGKIWAESQVNQGTKITFALPKYTRNTAAVKFLDNLTVGAVQKQPLMMLLYETQNYDALQTTLGEEKKNRIMRKILQLMNLNIRRIAGDEVIRSEGNFLVVLPQLEKENAGETRERIGKAIRKYLDAEGLLQQVQFSVSMMVYPEIKNDQGTFQKIIRLIVEERKNS